MKKLIMVLLVGVMAFSLAACGGGKASVETSGKSDVKTSEKPAEKPSDDEDSLDKEIEEAKKAVLSVTDESYSGLTAADGSVYFLLSSDGKFAVLVLEGSDEKTYVRFIGSATRDENNVITVTDQDSGNTFSFIAEAQDDGYFLDCGNLGELYVSPSDAEEVVDSMFITFEEMTDVTQKLIDEIGH